MFNTLYLSTEISDQVSIMLIFVPYKLQKRFLSNSNTSVPKSLLSRIDHLCFDCHEITDSDT
jgi:hypothetical protein